MITKMNPVQQHLSTIFDLDRWAPNHCPGYYTQQKIENNWTSGNPNQAPRSLELGLACRPVRVVGEVREPQPGTE